VRKGMKSKEREQVQRTDKKTNGRVQCLMVQYKKAVKERN
jgi:hypothetical protein